MVALAGSSVLASPSAPDVLSWLVDLLNVTVVGLLFYETAVGDGLVGLQLSWVLVGYLVYEYVPEVYLGSYGAVAELTGFRVLTAAVAVYFGVTLSVIGGFAPPAMAFGLVATEGAGAVWELIGGLFAGIAVFVAYFRLVRGERLADPDGDLWTVFEAFTVEDEAEMFERAEQLSRPTRTLLFAVTAVAVGALFVLPCLFLGFVLSVVNGFYPLPELVVFAGFALGTIARGKRFDAGLYGGDHVDLERYAVDQITDALRNMKGLVLSLYCGAGMLSGGLLFFLGLGLAGQGAASLAPVLGMLVEAPPRDPAVVAEILARIWFVVGLFAVLLAYGATALFYWLRQLRRLPPYVRYWERRWRGRARSPPPAPVARPPGLFLPGNLLLALLVWLLWSAPGGELTHPLLVAFGVAWPVAVAVAAWSIRRAFRADPQPLDGEARDVLVALTVQVGLIVLLGVAGGASPAASAVVVASFAALLVLFAYSPDVSVYSDRKIGAAGYLDVVYTGVLFVVALATLGRVGTVPTPLYGFVALLMALFVLFSYLDEQVDL